MTGYGYDKDKYLVILDTWWNCDPYGGLTWQVCNDNFDLVQAAQ